MSRDDCTWFCRKVSWYTLLVVATFGACCTAAVLQYEKALSLLEGVILDLGNETKQFKVLLSILQWGEGISWILMGLVLGGTIFNIWCKMYISYRREQFALGEEPCCSDTRFCCSLVSMTRIILNLVHGCCLLAISWFCALACTECAMICLFWSISKVASDSMDNQNGSEAKNLFTSDTGGWLEAQEDDLEKIIFNLGGYCSRVQCGDTITSSVATLKDMQKNMNTVSESLSGQGSGDCPAHGCMNANFLFLLKEGACKCDQETIKQVHDDALEGEIRARTSIWFLIPAFVMLLLLLSKMAMNLKSLVKDDHWMQRIELVLDRLNRAGVNIHESLVDLVTDASMSNFAISQSIVPQNSILDGYPMPAKVATAPPGAHIDGVHDSIQAAAWEDNRMDAPYTNNGSHPHL